MLMVRYSLFDAQLGKICGVCNKKTASAVIKNVKRIVSKEDDISGLTDSEIFSNWRYILFSHNKRVVANNKVTLDFMGGYDDIRILLPMSGVR